MPIRIDYSPDAKVVSDAAFSVGYGQAQAKNAALRAQMAQQIQSRGISNFASKRAAENAVIARDKATREQFARQVALEDVRADNRQEYQQQGIEGRGGLQDERLAAAEKNLGRRLTSQEEREILRLGVNDHWRGQDRDAALEKQKRDEQEKIATELRKEQRSKTARVEKYIDENGSQAERMELKAIRNDELDAMKIDVPEIREKALNAIRERKAKIVEETTLPPSPEEVIDAQMKEVTASGAEKMSPSSYVKNGIMFEADIDNKTGKVSWKSKELKTADSEKAKLDDERWTKTLTEYDKYLDRYDERLDKAVLHLIGQTKKNPITGEESPKHTEDEARAIAERAIGKPKPPPTKPGGPQGGGQLQGAPSLTHVQGAPVTASEAMTDQGANAWMEEQAARAAHRKAAAPPARSDENELRQLDPNEPGAARVLEDRRQTAERARNIELQNERLVRQYKEKLKPKQEAMLKRKEYLDTYIPNETEAQAQARSSGRPIPVKSLEDDYVKHLKKGARVIVNGRIIEKKK